ncbi:MAG: cation:proton antiporter [Paludibacteraceae bacterium]|nr:cation:proton antiporter [Paludibacteraceae bacterium]
MMSLPLTDPLSILALIIGIIWIVPPLCRRLHVPSIVGFIIVGILIGSNGFGVLSDSQTMQTLGKLGMLYIMLQAGIEIDLNNFAQYKRQAVFFGFLSFLLPFLLGMATSLWILQFNLPTSILLGAMYGSHTLMTYPIVGRYGVEQQRSVNVVVGGTMLTITLSLLVLAALKGHFLSTTDTAFWGPFLGKVLLFVVIVLLFFPFITRKAFLKDRDPMFSFMMVMAMLVSASRLAEWAGLESILGAFVCGVALNKYVPNRSPLMQRINFIGNSLFVPIFLIGVGMMIEVNRVWESWSIVGIALVMIVTKLFGKWLSSWLAQKLFRFTDMERQLIFGLTHATAAGTLAIVTIGHQMQLFDAYILNGAVLMILILCTTSSFVTEHAAKELALQDESHLEYERRNDSWLLLSVGEEIMPQLQELGELSELNHTELAAESDWNTVKEMVERTPRSIIIYHPMQTLSTISRLLVAVPRYAEKEHDFVSCFGQIRRLSSQIGAKVVFFCEEDTRAAIQALCRRKGKYLRASYREMEDWEDVLMIAKEVKRDDMIVLLSARKATPSYNPLFEQLPDMLSRFFKENSYLLLYPEQLTGEGENNLLLAEQVPHSRVWSAIGQLKKGVQALLYRIQTR